jgi:hypothetical protein
MLDGGDGGVGTSWATMSVPDMRRVIQSASTEGQWEIVGGWQKSAELLLEHKFQVEDFRKNLALAWPPGKSAASEAYLARLDALIKNLDETYEAALANHDALSAATGSIYQAQVKMEEIFKEYESNQTLLDQFTANQQKTQNGTPNPTPSGEEPPVAPGRQEQLRLQAATMLNGVSTELAQAQVRIQRPTLYQPLPQFDDAKTINDGGFTAPPIPPLGGSLTNDGGSSNSRSRPSTAFPTSTAVTVNPPVTPPATEPGLILGGTKNLPAPTPPQLLNPAAPTLPTGGPITGPALLSPSTSLLPGGGPAPLPSTPIGRGGLPREGLMRPGTPLPEGLRTMAPGGIIGGNPALGLGQPAAGRSAGQRVNPVGGVIGEQPMGGSSRSGGSRSGGIGGVYGPGARRSGQRDESDGTQWDPDNPWETAEGVEPIVLPSREQRVDPGPAIGLH